MEYLMKKNWSKSRGYKEIIAAAPVGPSRIIEWLGLEETFKII